MSEHSSKNREPYQSDTKSSNRPIQQSSSSAGNHSKQYSGSRSGSHSGHRGRRDGRSLKHRIKRFIRHNKLQVILSTLIILAVCVIAGAVLVKDYQKGRKSIQSGNSYDMGTGYRNITYKGKKYQYNSLITTVLYAGIDSFGKIETTGYTRAPRADTVSLVVLDKKHKKMTIIAFNRDTITNVHRYSLTGQDRGNYETYLGYAYTYGDGGRVSCDNLKEAVSALLGGIPVNEYIVTNQSSMPYINNLVGGVTVEVPNDDLVEMYPELYKGAVVKLDDSNISDYLHYRDTSINFSNNGRMQRQQAYVTAYIELAKQQARDNPEGTWNKLEDMNAYLQTSITKSKYLNLLSTVGGVEFSDNNYYRPDGEYVVGKVHHEFYIDKASLKEHVIDIFYDEI